MAAPPLATVLYEDQQGPNNQFGLHKFVMRCLCDQCAVAPENEYKVHGAVSSRQLKGDSKVLNALWNDLPNIAGSSESVIAVLDNDRIRDALGLSSQASDDEVYQTIRDRCAGPVQLVLLKENTESILLAAKECDGIATNDNATYELAVFRKELPARDIIFTKLSKRDAKAIRDCIRDKIGSLTPLIDRLVALLNPILGSAAGS